MKHLISSILAFLVLVTSTGFTISSHTCGGEIVTTAISFGNSDVSCGMENENSACDSKEQMKSNCCHDEFLKIQMDEEGNKKAAVKTQNPTFALAFVTAYFNLLQIETNKTDNFNNCAPPPLVRDIPLEVQSFLI